MHTDLESQPGLRQLMRSLPQVAQQPYPYQEFEQRALERERAMRDAGGRTRLLAAVIVAVAVGAVLLRLVVSPPQPASARGGAGSEQPAERSTLGDAGGARTLEQERLLASLPREPALVHVGTRSAVMGLQDRIAQLDDLLSTERSARAAPERLLALQQERTRLVGTLVQVRYAETLADDLP